MAGNRPTLIQAVLDGDIEQVRRLLGGRTAALSIRETATQSLLLKEATSSNALSTSGVLAEGFRPLHVAAWEGHTRIVELLLDAGAGPEDTTRLGWFPLLIAAQQGHVTIVELLIARGAQVDRSNARLGPALEAGSYRGHRPVVEVLLRAGADPNHKRPTGRPPLEAAAVGGHEHVVDPLLDAGADPLYVDENGWTPRMHAVWYRRLSMAGLMGQHGRSASLHDAAAAADTDAIESKLRAGAPIDEQGKYGDTALIWAARAGQHEAVELLLSAGADARREGLGGTPADCAAERGNLAVLALLLDQGSPTRRAMEQAAQAGQAAAVQLLLEHGASATAQSLVDAARGGQLKTTRLLLAAGAAVNEPDAAGFTALHCAVYNGYEKLVALLLAAGADPSLPDRDGMTAAAIAAAEDWDEIAELLAAHPTQSPHPRPWRHGDLSWTAGGRRCSPTAAYTATCSQDSTESDQRRCWQHATRARPPGVRG